jgi:hypothetical protein
MIVVLFNIKVESPKKIIIKAKMIIKIPRKLETSIIKNFLPM